jgi:hypothetical protein
VPEHCGPPRKFRSTLTLPNTRNITAPKRQSVFHVNYSFLISKMALLRYPALSQWNKRKHGRHFAHSKIKYTLLFSMTTCWGCDSGGNIYPSPQNFSLAECQECTLGTLPAGKSWLSLTNLDSSWLFRTGLQPDCTWRSPWWAQLARLSSLATWWPSEIPTAMDL